MLPTFICAHCSKAMPRNPRIKKQRYCGARSCQNARRLSTNRTRAKKSTVARSQRQSRNKRWREKRPAHEYQRQYRDSHPEYVLRNREQQKRRNKKRKDLTRPKIVKTYALAPEPFTDGHYLGFEIKEEKIVKTYAFFAGNPVPGGIQGHLPLQPG